MFDIGYWVAVLIFFVVVLSLATTLEDGRKKRKGRKGLHYIYIVGGVPSQPFLSRRRRDKKK